MEKEEIILNLNKKLKTLNTYDELIDFFKEMNSYGFGFMLYGKRRNYYAYSFTHLYSEEGYIKNHLAGLESSLNRVEYLYSDGVSVGRSYVKNLWRALRVSD